MTNVVKFKPAEFVNVHGKPITGLSMKQLVLRNVPDAWCYHREWTPKDDHARHCYTVLVPEYKDQPTSDQPFLGTGGTEEAAWRDAYFRTMEANPNV